MQKTRSDPNPPGLCIRDHNRLTATMSIATDGERILAVYAVVNPDKLS